MDGAENTVSNSNCIVVEAWKCWKKAIIISSLQNLLFIKTIILAKQPFWAITFIRRFCQTCLFNCELDHPVFTFLDFAAIFFYRVRSSTLYPTPNLEDQVSIYVPEWQDGWPSHNPKHRVPYSLHFMTRRATVEVFQPSSTWDPVYYTDFLCHSSI
jgi:hypothetical protein